MQAIWGRASAVIAPVLPSPLADQQAQGSGKQVRDNGGRRRRPGEEEPMSQELQIPEDPKEVQAFLEEAGFTNLGGVEETEVEWLWVATMATGEKLYLLPRGKLTLVDGHPGVGKSYVMKAATAALTSGSYLPGMNGTKPKPASVIYFTQEDDMADTIKPRIKKMGGNPDLVEVNSKTYRLDNPKHLKVIKAAIEHYGASLVIFDTLEGYVGNADTWKPASIRPLLLDLAAMAQETNSSIIGLRHFTKDDHGGDLLLRGAGSMSIAGVARSVLAVVEDPEDPERIALFNPKTNLGKKTKIGLGFNITDEGGIKWNLTDVPHMDDFKADKFHKPQSISKQSEAFRWLLRLLSHGPKPVKFIEEACAGQPFEYGTVEKVRKTMGIYSKRNGDHWEWELPDHMVGLDPDAMEDVIASAPF